MSYDIWMMSCAVCWVSNNGQAPREKYQPCQTNKIYHRLIR